MTGHIKIQSKQYKRMAKRFEYRSPFLLTSFFVSSIFPEQSSAFILWRHIPATSTSLVLIKL